MIPPLPQSPAGALCVSYQGAQERGGLSPCTSPSKAGRGLALQRVSNLDAERCVGAINYELKIRGNKELMAASACHVKAKAGKLIEGKPMDKRFVKKTRHLGPNLARIPAFCQKLLVAKKGDNYFRNYRQ